MHVDDGIEISDPRTSEEEPPDPYDGCGLPSFSGAPTYYLVSWSKGICSSGHPALEGVSFTENSPYRNGPSGLLTDNSRKAIRACLACPIRDECGTHGHNESAGIWGGETTKMREGKPLNDEDLAWLVNNPWIG